MEELKISPEELKILITEGKLLGDGFFGSVFTYKDRLIKLDRGLYSLLNGNDISSSNWAVEYFYRFEKEDFNDRTQLEELAKKQKDITLTKLPTGIVTMRDVSPKIMGISPGIIIPYHKNHKALELLDEKDYKKVLIILKKLLMAVRELADNEIAQEDLYHSGHSRRNTYNILYKGKTPQIIDVSGRLVKVGKEFENAQLMYNELGNVIIDFFTYNALKSPYERTDVNSYEANVDLLRDFEEQTKGKSK